MENKADRAAAAVAALRSIEPLMDLLLEMGVSSREAESLFRGIFVRRAHKWLRQRSGAEPSVQQVALVTGIHRNFVSRILKEHPNLVAAQRRRGLKIDRLIEAWSTMPGFQDGQGKPAALTRDSAREPSLKSLIRKCIPGAPLGGTSEQLLRLKLVRMLPDGRIQLNPPRAKQLTHKLARRVGRAGKEVLASVIKGEMR
jgi:hypothetical protein